jgi:hypothetical protein
MPPAQPVIAERFASQRLIEKIHVQTAKTAPRHAASGPATLVAVVVGLERAGSRDAEIIGLRR